MVTVPPDADIVQGTRRLLEGPYGCLPVVDADHRLTGLLTVTDLLRASVAFQQTREATACYPPRRVVAEVTCA